MIFLDLFVFATNVIRKGYKPHMSEWYTIIAGVLTFLFVFLVLFVRYRFSKELKKRGLRERDLKRRKKSHRR